MEPQALDPHRAVKDPNGDLAWYDLSLLPLEGRGWPDAERMGDRLPARVKAIVPAEVWKKSLYPSGLLIRFESNTDRLFCRWYDRDGQLVRTVSATMNLPDVYVRTDTGWRHLHCSTGLLKYDRAWIADDMDAVPRSYLLYLPVQGTLSKIELGIHPEAWIKPLPKPPGTPIVFYGTSITCGQYASHAGATYSAILGRWLDWPVINLGFPGNGKMELETVKLISEIDASIFVLDCLPNMNPELVAERTEPAVHLLRQQHPRSPIVLMECIPYEDGWLVNARRKTYQALNAALNAAYERLQSAGISNIHLIPGDTLLGDDGEATVDGTHCNDLGFRRMATALHGPLSRLLLQYNLNSTG